MADRFRNFATVLYADSAPDDFYDRIVSWHVPCLLSPYHENDVNADGSIKKPHWHLMIMFEGLKSEKQVKALFDEVNGVGLEVINSMRGYARYLCHLDNPEKAQYNPDDITEFSGASYAEICLLDTDKVKIIAEMQEWCAANDVRSYRELCDYARLYHYTWYRMLALSCSNVMLNYLRSYQWEQEKDYKPRVMRSDSDVEVIVE